MEEMTWDERVSALAADPDGLYVLGELLEAAYAFQEDSSSWNRACIDQAVEKLQNIEEANTAA